jgi:hypothetical protein
LRDALGQVLAEERWQWRRERELIEAQAQAVVAQLKATIVELADVMDALGNPDAMTLGQSSDRAAEIGAAAADWLMERKNRGAIPHRTERCDYVPVRNPDAGDGLWKLKDKRQVIYAKARLSLCDQLAAARRLI